MGRFEKMNGPAQGDAGKERGGQLDAVMPVELHLGEQVGKSAIHNQHDSRSRDGRFGLPAGGVFNRRLGSLDQFAVRPPGDPALPLSLIARRSRVGIRSRRLVGERSTNEAAEDCRRENGLKREHFDLPVPATRNSCRQMPSIALPKRNRSDRWRQERLMLMRVGQKSNRDASVQRSRFGIQVARTRDSRVTRVRIFGEIRG